MRREAALLGRAAELEVLNDVLARVERGESAVIEVAGEPGIGKSRLLSELSEQADDRGFLVLGGRAAELLQMLPFGVFTAALDDYLGSLQPAALDGLDPRWYPELATALPAFVALAGDRPASLHAERFQTHRAVRALLEFLAREQPAAVVLDDVHWADSASVELLIHLLAHPPKGAVLLAVGYRPAQVAPRLRSALGEAVRARAAEHLEIRPLDLAEVRALVRQAVGDVPCHDLYRDSGGNPFYLEQLLRGFGLAHASRPLSLTRDRVPAPVASALAAELAALHPTARRLLEGAAVAGDPFEDDVAAVAAEVAPGDALGWLDHLLECDLIRSTIAPRRFRFRHPIVRRAIYESVRSSWRVEAHARVAAAQRAQGATATALAPHVERSAGRGDETAISVLVEAAAAAELRAPATAGDWYDAALRLVPDTPEEFPRRLELLCRMAVAQGTAGRLDESHAALCQVLDLLPEGTEGRVGLVAFCASIERLQGHVDDARRRLTQSLASAGSTIDAAVLKVELAIDSFVSCDYSSMRSWAEAALDLAESLDDPLVEASAASMLAIAQHNLMMPVGDHLDRARSIIDSLPDDRLAVRLDAATWLSYAEMAVDRFADAHAHSSRVVQVARATGRGQFIAMTMIGQLYSLLFTGRLDEAEQVADAAIDSFGPAGEPALAEALCCRGFVRMARGDITGAIRDGEQALELHKSRGHQPLLESATAFFLASFLIEGGDPQRARELIVSRLGPDGVPLGERRGQAVALETLTRAELELSDLDAADTWARRAESRVGSGELASQAAPARRAVAAVRLARGDGAGAAELALLAADATASASPLEAGRSRILAGHALAQAGLRDQAAAQLGQAETQLAACGAWFYRDQATAALRRLGLRRRQRPADLDGALASLSERERLVAELVALGKSNREIAAECYLSVKTVERHIGHLFDKLGVNSRSALAVVVTREG